MIRPLTPSPAAPATRPGARGNDWSQAAGVATLAAASAMPVGSAVWMALGGAAAARATLLASLAVLAATLAGRLAFRVLRAALSHAQPAMVFIAAQAARHGVTAALGAAVFFAASPEPVAFVVALVASALLVLTVETAAAASAAGAGRVTEVPA